MKGDVGCKEIINHTKLYIAFVVTFSALISGVCIQDASSAQYIDFCGTLKMKILFGTVLAILAGVQFYFAWRIFSLRKSWPSSKEKIDKLLRHSKILQIATMIMVILFIIAGIAK